MKPQIPQPGPDAEEAEDGATAAESPSARLAEASPTSPRVRARTSSHDEATRPGLGSGQSSSALHSATAIRAMHSEELMRARGFGAMIALLSTFALVPIGLVARESNVAPLWLHLLTVGVLAVSGISGTWVWLRVRGARRPYRMIRIFAVSCVTTALTVQYYAGLFSPAPTLIALGIAYFGFIDDRPLSYVVCLGSSFAYLVIALLVLGGLLPDLGMFRAPEAPLVLRFTAVGTVMAVYLFMFVQTRQSRSATHLAVERLDEALRLVQQREALLDEANQNLDVALAAGGRRGAYTGRAVGAYRLGELLGRGGMGEVYAAVHQKTSQAAAVKLLPGQFVTSPGAVARFVREAEVAMRLRAPNLVEIFEAGETDDGSPFLAMELLKGRDLGWHLRRTRQLPLPELVALIQQIARGLTVAHAAGVVHRDLKPANVFSVDEPATPEARWKLLDFGVAKLRGSQGTLTQRALVGTPGYMSPEQATGIEVDLRSDLFSLGALIYRALTGRPAFSGPDTPRVLFDVVYRSPTRPSELAPMLEPDIDLVLAISLTKDRDRRFASAAELATAFEAATHGALSAALRARGAAQVRALPWGRTVKPREGS